MPFYILFLILNSAGQQSNSWSKQLFHIMENCNMVLCLQFWIYFGDVAIFVE